MTDVVFDPFDIVEKGWNPNQPRVPAGTPNGGQWASRGGSEADLSQPRALGRPVASGAMAPNKQGIGVTSGASPTDGMTPQEAHDWKYDNREVYAPDAKAAAVAAAYRAQHGLPEPKFGSRSITDIKADLDRARVVASLARTNAERTGGEIDLETRIAYNDLTRQTAAQLDAMKRAGIKVEYLTKKQIIERGLDPQGLNPYPTAKAQRDSVAKSGTLMIASLADYPDSYHPILDSKVGGTYDQFRAVHDYFGHVAVGTGFDRHGEFQAYLHHASMFTGPARRAAASELHVENSFLSAYGVSAPHFAYLLPEDLVVPYREDGTFKGSNWIDV